MVEKQDPDGGHTELDTKHADFVVRLCNILIRQGIRILSLLMVIVIFWSLLDACYTFYLRAMTPPLILLEATDLLVVFGAVLTVLIATEIYVNVTLYLTENVIHIRLVVATALMAVARKIIAFDPKTMTNDVILAYAALALALGAAYWLVGFGQRR